MDSIVAWRRLKGQKNPPGVLTVRDRIDVGGSWASSGDLQGAEGEG